MFFLKKTQKLVIFKIEKSENQLHITIQRTQLSGSSILN